MTYEIDETHDANLTSWVESANDPATEFPIQNLPLCNFMRPDASDFYREHELTDIGVRIGDYVVDLDALDAAKLLEGVAETDGEADNTWLAAEPELRTKLRKRLSELFSTGNNELQSNKHLVKAALLPADSVEFHVPSVVTRDYTDFYASIHHATNVGSMFRPDNPLLPNYKWVPIGYHGRASSIVPSGTPIVRPSGQLKADDADAPAYGPCRLLDYEMEVGFFVAQGSASGEPVPMERAEEHILGLCLVNDWSARDIQKWEYQPLGPFLSKSFATSVSPYVVTMEALAPFRCAPFERAGGDPRPLPYLDSEENRARGGVDLTVEVYIESKRMRDEGAPPMRISSGSFKEMYWTVAQMLTHHSSNGCNLQPGDLMASGTVSGPDEENRGCLLERTWRGQRPISLPTGEERKFLQDHDVVIMKGYCEREGFRRIGFGECRGEVLPAKG